MKIYIIWLIGVVIWNFGVPNATPLEDVIVAIVLSFFSIIMKKYFRFLIESFIELISELVISERSFFVIGLPFK